MVVDETGLVLTNFHVIAGEIRDGSRRVLSASGTPDVGALRARFAAFDHPGAREIVGWLDGAYAIGADELQTQ